MDQKYLELEKRIEALEKIVFSENRKIEISESKDGYKGATGGLRLLIFEGFLDQKKSFGEIRQELSKKGYNYSPQAIQTPLNNVSKAGGLLVSFKEKGGKVYAKRK